MLNTQHFTVLAGNPGKWDAETRTRVAAGESLTSVQEDQHRRGRRSAELQESVYGFYVRSGSGLDGFAILAATKHRSGPLDGSREAAVAWGKKWVEEDPENREFYVRMA